MPYVLVQALRYGSVRLEAFSDARLEEPASREMMQKVVMTACPELTRQFPLARAARVRLVLQDGRVLEHFSPFRKGDPEAPLTDLELEQKFAELVTPVIGSDATRWLGSQIWKLEELQLSDLNLVSLG